MTRVLRIVLIASVTAVLALFVLPSTAYADNCGSLTDCYGTAQAALAALVGLSVLFGVLLSLALDLLPGIGTVKGIIEAITGRDLVTGEELAWWERALGFVPVLGALADAAKAAKAAGKLPGRPPAIPDPPTMPIPSPPRPPARRPSAGRTAADARDEGLVTPDRPGFGSYSTAPSVRRELGVTGKELEAAHVLPQAVGRYVPGYSPGRAPTIQLPPATHRAFDQGWISQWNAAVASGRPITAGDVYQMVSNAIQGIPDHMLSPAAKGALDWRLHMEMFADHGLQPGQVLVPGR